ncbi:MAG: polymer-forming cytoskeletal protein [Leptospiraceae bacterium]|nr:polymer-forming cytoskeletal protein [Leptospiraceae bacterium]MCB1202296.1 polymer-forming cytoskeletal protein [Leptospiraceae bacterium]
MEPTLISDDIEFKGEVQFDNTLLIKGNFEGVLRGSGKVEVSSGGSVKGDFYVRQIELHGKIQGNIHSADSVSISSGGILSGDIECREIQIDRGARHNGATIMK